MTYKEIKFAALYQVPWILKWTLHVANLPLEKFGIIQNRIPYLGRKVYIKWWDKYDFFAENSIFSTQGIFDFEPRIYRSLAPESSKSESISDLLSRMLEKTSRVELKKQLKALMSDSEEEEDEIESHQSDDMKSQ